MPGPSGQPCANPWKKAPVHAEQTAPVPETADSLQRGLANRRRVLGDAWVQRSVENANVLNVEFQRMITAYAWDGIWSRPGLERRTRRIMVLAITAAMGRWEEFELHIRTGLQADPADSEAAPLDLDTIREVLLQTAVYAVCLRATPAWRSRSRCSGAGAHAGGCQLRP
jgi:alkylhydroperoxidase/carboxymuconolactone decarboxylase family protein YurZ